MSNPPPWGRAGPLREERQPCGSREHSLRKGPPSACHTWGSETPASLGPRPHGRGQEPSPAASPGRDQDRDRDRYWDRAARDTAGPRSPSLPPVLRGLLQSGTGPRAAASPPPRSRAGAPGAAPGGQRSGPGTAPAEEQSPPPRRPLCPARGTARLREARHSPYRAVPASPPHLSAPLRSPGCSHRQQGSSRPVPSPPALPPPLPPRAASRRRGGCSGGRCVGPRRALPREPPPPLPRTHRPPAGALSGSTGREGGKSLSKYRHS